MNVCFINKHENVWITQKSFVLLHQIFLPKLYIYSIMIGTQEIIIIALIVLLLFGGKKIPELMKGMGKGVKSFKDGMNGIEDKIETDDKKEQKSEK